MQQRNVARLHGCSRMRRARSIRASSPRASPHLAVRRITILSRRVPATRFSLGGERGVGLLRA